MYSTFHFYLMHRHVPSHLHTWFNVSPDGVIGMHLRICWYFILTYKCIVWNVDCFPSTCKTFAFFHLPALQLHLYINWCNFINNIRQGQIEWKLLVAIHKFLNKQNSLKGKRSGQRPSCLDSSRSLFWLNCILLKNCLRISKLPINFIQTLYRH